LRCLYFCCMNKFFLFPWFISCCCCCCCFTLYVLGTMDFRTAREYCESVGARLCTRYELRHDECYKTGCNYDVAEVWTTTRCGNNGTQYLVIIEIHLHSFSSNPQFSLSHTHTLFYHINIYLSSHICKDHLGCITVRCL